MSAQREISIWFFCGALLLASGLVLVVQGILEIHHPPATVLSQLQPTLWWGVLLTLCGGLYTVRFRPRSAQVGNASESKTEKTEK